MKKIQGCVNKGMQAQQTFPERIKVIIYFQCCFKLKFKTGTPTLALQFTVLGKSFYPIKCIDRDC